MSQYWIYIAVGIALLIIALLSFYAGKLLFQLKLQKQQQQLLLNQRIETFVESIQTIALAIEQQQCNLSEGVIRLVNLLESLPTIPPISCQKEYPSIYALFVEVRHLPTHDARAALSKKERFAQDKVREEHEARLESKILQEVKGLTTFTR